MKEAMSRKSPGVWFPLAVLLTVPAVVFLIDAPLQAVAAAGLLWLAGGVTGVSLRAGRRGPRGQQERTVTEVDTETKPAGTGTDAPLTAGPSGVSAAVPHAGRRAGEDDSVGKPVSFDGVFLQVVVDELARMQASEDLLERYGCFHRIVETALSRVLGECNITWWCPNEEHTELIECVVRSGSLAEGAIGGFESVTRIPQQVPYDSRIIDHVVRTGRAFLVCDPRTKHLPADVLQHGTLRSEACVVLYRPYGQPLVINVDRLRRTAREIDPDDFRIAVELIKMVWDQLQAANQRHWMIEHDPASRTLREETFLRQAQQYVDQARRRDEPFAVVVLTLHGFRGMFAGQSQQWRRLSAAAGRWLQQALTDRRQPFLLGRTADDVFAVLLPHADRFLARTTMQHVQGVLEQNLPRDATVRHLDVPALELRWTCADAREYRTTIVDLLDRMYRRLFTRGMNKDEAAIRIELQPVTEEVS